MRIAELGTPFAEKTVVALGFFDSIHIGPVSYTHLTLPTN